MYTGNSNQTSNNSHLQVVIVAASLKSKCLIPLISVPQADWLADVGEGGVDVGNEILNEPGLCELEVVKWCPDEVETSSRVELLET